MFQKSIESIIAQGVKDLEAVVKQTRQAADDAKIRVSQCQGEIQALVNLAKQVPEKVFDRYSNILTGTFVLQSDYQSSNYVCIGQHQAMLNGLMGDEKMRLGKYRVIVLLEPIS